MKLAIDAADLCDPRVDGTRVYIKNILDLLGKLDQESRFFIYLKGKLNPELQFKTYPNYTIQSSRPSRFWTQTRFPGELRKDQPDLLWMPLQTIPYFISPELKVVTTIHDLAFKIYPQHFPLKDRLLLSLFTKRAVERANKVIAVSKNTKEDIQNFYQIPAEKITVIHHGFNKDIFNQENASNQARIAKVKAKYKIKGPYLLYVGALQPRKNLNVLIKAFEKIKNNAGNPELKLVIAGARAWLFKDIFSQAASSAYSQDIILTGAYQTEELPALLGGASIFVFPSLYEGFGIPLLEAFACGTPVICADNSSFKEVGGEAPLYFESKSATQLAMKIKTLLQDKDLQIKAKEAGFARAAEFSWEKCAKETLELLKKTAQVKT